MLVTQLFRTSITHFYFDRTMIEREKAKSIALGGIDLAISILTPPEKTPQEESAPAKEPAEKVDPNVELLKKILPTLNHWQEYLLTEEHDGLAGSIKFCITCEDGKININQLYDFGKKKFIGEGTTGFDGKKFCKSLFSLLKKWVGGKDLFEVFEKFLKQRQYKLNDVTELLFIKEFQESFKTTVFYEAPPLEGSSKKEQRPVYLTDIFTMWSTQQKINPWLLSDSVAALLGFKRAEPGDTSAREKEVDQLLKGLKTVQGDLKIVWEKALQKLYGKELKTVPNDITTALAQQFEAKTFGVLCHGTVGHITQKLFAIIERQNDKAVPYTVKKLYWL